MVRTADRLLEEALRLPESDRGAIAAGLLDSLDDTDAPDLDAAWDEELRARIADVESGREVPVPHDQAVRMIFEGADADGD